MMHEPDEKGRAKDHDDAGGFARPPVTQAQRDAYASSSKASAPGSTQRLRDLWLREIDAADAEALVAIAAELGLSPNSSDAWSERIRLSAYVQQLLRQRGESITYDAEGAETPDDRHASRTGETLEAVELELDAMRECVLELDQLDVDARQRVLTWLASRYGGGRR